jgi:malate dehydrogenase (quinone)
MVLAVGKEEVQKLESRYSVLKNIFPEIQKLNAREIQSVEPEVMRKRNPHEPVLALFNPEGYAVDFGALACSFIAASREQNDKKIDVFLKRPVTSIEKEEGLYTLRTKNGDLHAKVIVVDTDAHSLGFAKKMGYGKEYSLIPIAGTFYFSKELLRGKVYTMQEPRMPFAAVHGDPDLSVPPATRWGPTARFFPVLESRKPETMPAYFASSGLHRARTWISFFRILLEPVRFKYFLKNILYELPFIGKYFFVHQAQKIVPTIRGKDLRRAQGFGGMRLQRVNTTTRELLLGEGKIVGDNIIFNMTPSPGASVCLHNALRDTEQIISFLDNRYVFSKEKMRTDLTAKSERIANKDVSLKDSYPS